MNDRPRSLDDFPVSAAARDEARTATAPRGGPTAPDPPLLTVDPWWASAVDVGKRSGIGAAALVRAFPQLRFPIEAGISDSPAFRAAVRQGNVEAAPDPPSLNVSVSIVDTLAGDIPCIVAHDRPTFEAVHRSLAARNEPVDVPPTMGASFVRGVIHWGRAQAFVEAWLSDHPDDSLADARRALAQRPDAYRDRVLIASTGPYSAIADPRLSGRDVPLRIAHEGAHAFTQLAFGSLGHSIAEELVADHIGLVAAIGAYPADLARRLLGVTDDGAVAGGRISNYRGSLSDAGLQAVAHLASRAIARLAEREVPLGRPAGRARVIELTTTSLDVLAFG